jgi:hypothetical protein
MNTFIKLLIIILSTSLTISEYLFLDSFKKITYKGITFQAILVSDDEFTFYLNVDQACNDNLLKEDIDSFTLQYKKKPDLNDYVRSSDEVMYVLNDNIWYFNTVGTGTCGSHGYQPDRDTAKWSDVNDKLTTKIGLTFLE